MNALLIRVLATFRFHVVDAITFDILNSVILLKVIVMISVVVCTVFKFGKALLATSFAKVFV